LLPGQTPVGAVGGMRHSAAACSQSPCPTCDHFGRGGQRVPCVVAVDRAGGSIVKGAHIRGASVGHAVGAARHSPLNTYSIPPPNPTFQKPAPSAAASTPGTVRPAAEQPHLIVMPQKKTEKIPLRCSSSPIRYARKPSSATRDTSLPARQRRQPGEQRGRAGHGGRQTERAWASIPAAAANCRTLCWRFNCPRAPPAARSSPGPTRPCLPDPCLSVEW
jgi:hypothetical protein